MKSRNVAVFTGNQATSKTVSVGSSNRIHLQTGTLDIFNLCLSNLLTLNLNGLPGRTMTELIFWADLLTGTLGVLIPQFPLLSMLHGAPTLCSEVDKLARDWEQRTTGCVPQLVLLSVLFVTLCLVRVTGHWKFLNGPQLIFGLSCTTGLLCSNSLSLRCLSSLQSGIFSWNSRSCSETDLKASFDSFSRSFKISNAPAV